MRILLVEDDDLLGEGISQALGQAGDEVVWLDDGEQALEMMLGGPFNLVLLDLNLPGVDGLTLLRTARARGCEVPVIILTARDSVDDRISGLDEGADDYLVKPFDFNELQARIRAIHRRSNGRATSNLSYGDIVLDPYSQTVYYKGVTIVLTRREYVLLKELMENQGRVLTRFQLEQALYGWGDSVESNALEVHIHHLRKKFYPDLIRTIRGVGYIIEKRHECAPSTASC
jgi:two-component system response regulator QseB